MNIIKKNIEDKFVAIVEGEIKNSEEIKSLIDTINNPRIIEIVFIDQTFLPLDVIISLSKSKIKKTPLKRQLWYYFEKLNLKDIEYRLGYKNIIKDKILALCIGGSAGSLESIMTLVKNLKEGNISIFIVLHQDINFESKLVQLLKPLNKYYDVVQAINNEQVKEKTIYIAPSDNHLLVINGFIFLTKTDKIKFARPSIDVTFNSLSLEYTNSLVCVLLSGYGNDGSDSLLNLKKNNSTVLAQDPKECEVSQIVQSAIDTNCVNKILNLNGISEYLNSKITTASDINLKNDILNFLKDINIHYHYDFSDYQIDFINRRIKIVMARLGFIDYRTFYEQIFKNKAIFEDFLSDFSINVTEFFRDIDVFKEVYKNIFSYIESFPIIKIWCAGCSTGEEVYSLAILLKEYGVYDRCRIYATDFNNIALNEAKNGIFSLESLEQSSKSYKEIGGLKSFEDYINIEENYFSIKDDIKKNILFFEHNLVKDSSINEFQLIFCRNVLIYFNSVLQNRVINLLESSLCRNGFLILGKSESISSTSCLKTISKEKRIFKKGS